MQSPIYLCAYYREHIATQGFPALSMGKHLQFVAKVVNRFLPLHAWTRHQLVKKLVGYYIDTCNQECIQFLNIPIIIRLLNQSLNKKPKNYLPSAQK